MLHFIIARWYSGVVSLPDGRAIIAGGSTGGIMATSNQIPTFSVEFIPPINYPVRLPILERMIDTPSFVNLILLPNGHVFILALNQSMTFDPLFVSLLSKTQNNTLQENSKSGVRVFPNLTGMRTGIYKPIRTNLNLIIVKELQRPLFYYYQWDLMNQITMQLF